MNQVPRLLIVSGPNGAGKSTMLYQLHRNKQLAEPGTRVMYINSSRPWRAGIVNALAPLGLENQTFTNLIEGESIPGWPFGVPPGMTFLQYNQGSQRGRDLVDDVQSLVKVAILRLETSRQRAITKLVDSGKRGSELDFDAFEPMKRYVSTLLPHLRFDGVDLSDSANQKVFFIKLDGEQEIRLEIDDLSAGEKAVIGLLYPFIEDQAYRLMNPAERPAGPTPTVLIDEPELHLHPALQSNLIAYMRELAVSGEAQFIICTHSTTIIDAATEGELYVLAPPAITGGNQLVPVADSASRLEAMRELTGSAYTITRCRPIVFVEGERFGARVPSDSRILEILIPESKSWVIVPSQGRSQVIASARNLQDPALTGLPGLSVFALVDRDQSDVDEEFVISWPVTMQENLLLDIKALWEVMQPHLGDPRLPASENELEDQLRVWCREQREREIYLRVRSRLKPLAIHEAITTVEEFDDLHGKVTQEVGQYLINMGGRTHLEEVVRVAEQEVDGILENLEIALVRFHGKDLLDKVYEKYAAAIGWTGKAAFAYNLAAAVSRADSDRLRQILSQPVRKIKNFVPQGLESSLRSLLGLPEYSEVASLADRVVVARKYWLDGEVCTVDRVQLRADILAVSRRLRAEGHEVEARNVVTELSRFVVG
ncbi:AAA family ATPase [Amycolatopsis sp. NPDC088138]|uniref:AAA family ATPase n=1 Tax=Amycolatopsis sp. NPDC088138 TaxID=3363938 RepID=UPI003816AB73